MSVPVLQSFAVPHSFNETVYICVTGNVYHKTPKCRGLANATHAIKAVSREEAINKYGRRACKICY